MGCMVDSLKVEQGNRKEEGIRIIQNESENNNNDNGNSANNNAAPLCANDGVLNNKNIKNDVLNNKNIKNDVLNSNNVKNDINNNEVKNNNIGKDVYNKPSGDDNIHNNGFNIIQDINIKSQNEKIIDIDADDDNENDNIIKNNMNNSFNQSLSNKKSIDDNSKDNNNNKNNNNINNNNINNNINISENNRDMPKHNENKEEEKELEDKKFKNRLKILLINLEANHVNIEEINQEINTTYDSNIGKDVSYEKIFKQFIEKITKLFEKELKLNNNEDKKYLSEIIESISNKYNNIKDFKEILLYVLENFINFKTIKNDTKKIIEDYIIDFINFETIKDKINDLKKKYENNYIIKYDEYNEDIIFKNQIFMDNNANEYLLYLMKKSVIDKNNNYSIDSLDLEILLKFDEINKNKQNEDKKH